MEFCALASGSSGNCFYIGNNSAGILVDVGISAKQVVERMIKIKKDPEMIKAIFITHEHSDHIRGVDVLSRKLNIPVFATSKTIENSSLRYNALIKEIKSSNISIGKLRIESFSKFHSAADPVSFNIYDNKKVSVITDAGHACKNIKTHVASCDLLCIESNHDEEMLSKGPYPAYLKKWIKGDEGHLSNAQASSCIRDHASEKLKYVVLSHISQTNNTPQIALKTCKNILSGRSSLFPKFAPSIQVSVREVPTQVFSL